MDILVGLGAIAVGVLLTVRGYTALRGVIAAWGALAGLLLGASVTASVTDTALLSTWQGWLAGIVAASLLGLIAYLYYAVSVILGMAAIGFALGSAAMVALGVPWTWVIVLVGAAVGVLLAVLAIVGDLPMLLLAVLGAFAGASVTLAGVLLVIGVIDRTGVDPAQLELGWWWNVAYLLLAAVGVVVQLRREEARRGTLREAWSA